MNKITNTFKLTAVAAALFAAYGSALADDAEIAELSKPESSISVGAGHWSNTRQQQGMFDGMREEGAYGLLDAEIVKRDDASGTWYIFNGERLGLDSRKFEAEIQQQGNIGGVLKYKRIQRENPLIINTGLQGIGDEVMTVSGSGVNALPFRKVQLGTYRDLVEVGFNKSLLSGVDLRVGFKDEERRGSRHWGLGSQALFLVEPIDSTTKQLDVTLEYTGEKFQLAGGYAGSWYGNHNDLVLATIKGARPPETSSSPLTTPLTLPLDNEAHQFFLNAGYSFTPSTRATLKVSRSVATQDETLPSIALTGVNTPFSGAPSRLDGEIVTSLVELGLTSRPTNDLSLSGSLRYYDVDDKTPVAAFVDVTDNNGVRTVVHNTPHSYTTNSAKVEATYRLPQRFKVIAGIDVKQQDRSAPKFFEERYVPFNEKLDETTYRVQLRRSMSETVNGSVAFLHSTRDGSSRAVPHEPGSIKDGGKIYDMINPLHIADRTRNKWRVSMDWAPVEAFNVQFNVEDSRDDYDREDGRPYGLDEGRASLVSVDVQYALSSNWQVTGWLSHDVTRAQQLGGRWQRQTAVSVPNMVKDADLEDTGDSVGVGLRGGWGEKVKLGADLQWTRTRSSYDEDTVPARAATELPLPDIENRLTRLSMFARYAVRKDADVQLDVIHERWKSDDWSWQFANGSPFTYGAGGATGTDNTVVSAKPKQTANFIGMRYIYKFQ